MKKWISENIGGLLVGMCVAVFGINQQEKYRNSTHILKAEKEFDKTSTNRLSFKGKTIIRHKQDKIYFSIKEIINYSDQKSGNISLILCSLAHYFLGGFIEPNQYPTLGQVQLAPLQPGKSHKNIRLDSSANWIIRGYYYLFIGVQEYNGVEQQYKGHKAFRMHDYKHMIEI